MRQSLTGEWTLAERGVNESFKAMVPGDVHSARALRPDGQLELRRSDGQPPRPFFVRIMQVDGEAVALEALGEAEACGDFAAGQPA